MVTAYILIEMAAGHSVTLVGSLTDCPEVINTDRVTGPYDVVVTLKANDVSGISNIVADQIHARPGVIRTTTCVSLK